MSDTIKNFISNIVKSIRSSDKKLKTFEYLKNNIHRNGFVFLQEAHTSTQDEKKWKDYFKDSLLFSHVSRNSYKVVIGFCGLKSLPKTSRKSEENGQILIIDAKVNDEKYLLLNLYNLNTESEHVKSLDTLKSLLDDISDKKRTLGGHLCGGGNACGGNPVLKNKSLTKFIKIKGSLNRCNI